MKLPIVAVAITPYYLDPKLTAVKYMSVTKDKNNYLRWRTVGVFGKCKNRITALGIACDHAADFKVPVFEGIKKGMKVSREHFLELLKRGLLTYLELDFDDYNKMSSWKSKIT